MLLQLNEYKGGKIMAKQKFYAVKNGHKIGVFNTWAECQESINGFSGAEFKKFDSEDEAKAYIDGIDIVMDNDIIPRLNEGKVVAFIDGSYDNGKRTYGSGACIFAPNKINIELCSSGKNEKYIELRNIAGEVISALNTIDWAWKNEYDKICIFHDYEGIGKWASGEWKTNNALTSYYKRYIDDKNGIISIEFVKVSGHSNNKYNDRADKLAKSAVFDNKVIRDWAGNSGYIISPVTEEDICELLKKIKEESKGLDFSKKESPNKKCWSVTFNGERIQISLFNNIKMTVQGKKNNLFQIVTTAVVETIQCGDFIQVLRSAYGISIDKAKIDDDYKNKLPTISDKKLPQSIVCLVKQAIVNLSNPARCDSEFSMYTFPALRAVEGVLKYNLSKCEIVMNSFCFDVFTVVNGVYKLKHNYVAKLTSDRILKLENCYNYLHNNRHTLFHFGIIIGDIDVNTRLITTKAEADGIIKDALKIIDENYIL